MSELRSTSKRISDVVDALRLNPDAWLARASPSGRPHLVAVSTWWDERQVTIATIGSSRTAQNLDETRLGRLAIGSPDDVIAIDVELTGSVPAAEAGPQLAGFTEAVGWNPAVEEGSWRFFQLRPVRVQAYRGYGELEGRGGDARLPLARGAV
jgi:hypothetical protein